jgi:aspartate/methionine/tyrosine aminotransferase
VNSPNNPTGRVFSREELLQVAALAQEFDALVITDDIYEHIFTMARNTSPWRPCLACANVPSW